MEAGHPPGGLGASSLLADAKSRGKRCYELQVRECRDSLTEAIGDGKLKRCRRLSLPSRNRGTLLPAIRSNACPCSSHLLTVKMRPNPRGDGPLPCFSLS